MKYVVLLVASLIAFPHVAAACPAGYYSCGENICCPG